MFWLGVDDFAQNAAVEALLDRLRPSLAYLGDVRRPTGVGALVDSSQGLFLAHTDAVQGDTVQARVGEWRVSLRVLGEDVRTGLVILGLRSDAPGSVGPAIAIADSVPEAGSKACLVFADGGLVATYVGGTTISVGDKRPASPVSEIRFENPSQYVGGALVMSFDGKLIGAMGATVARNSSAITLRALKEVKKGLSGTIGPPQLFNPGRLTIAYTPSLSLVRRSVSGLVAKDHRAEYAALGIQVGDVAPGGGAIVRRVVSDSPAGRSGIKVDDVLLAVGDHAIFSQYDFLQAMLAFRPGERTMLHVRHDGTEARVEVTLARSKN